MGSAASKTFMLNGVNADGQKLVIQITNKRGKNDTPRAKPSPEVELEVDLGDIVSPCINVMFICSEWGSKKGGLSTFNRELAVNLAKISNDRIKVHCYVSESSEAERQDANSKGVNLIPAQRFPGSNDPLDWLSTPPSDLLRPDVVVAHGRKFGDAAYVIRKNTNCRWIHFVHVNCEALGKHKLESSVTADAIAEYEEKNRRELELCKASELVVAVGSLLQRKYQRSLGDIKVEVITPGIFEEYVNPTATQSELELSEEEFNIFMFGRGSFEDFFLKGYDIVGKAVASLERKFELTFVGAPQDEQRKIETWFVEETKIPRNQLTIRGFCGYKEMKGMLREADLVVMPSRTEGFGLVALEAISAGVPVLVSSETGIAKALQDVQYGISVIVKSGASEEWANKIRLLSEQTRGYRHTIALRLREQYKLKYSWETECKKFEKMILELVERSDQSEIPLNLTENTTVKEVLKAVLKADDVQSPKNEDRGLLNTDLNTSSEKAEHTKRRKEGKKATDQGTSDKNAKQVNRSDQSIEQADPDTSDKTAEQTTERKTGGQGAVFDADQDTPNKTREKIKGGKKKAQVEENTTLKDSLKAVLKADDVQSPKSEDRGLLNTDLNTSSEKAEQTKRRKEGKKATDQGTSDKKAKQINRSDQSIEQADPDTSDNTAEQTTERKTGGQGPVFDADQDTSNKTREKIKEGKEKAQVEVFAADQDTSNKTREKTKGDKKKVQAAGGTSVSEDNKELNQLHSAERDSNVTEMKLTLPPGFSVDFRNATGRTPLMNAALNGNVQAVKSIMKRGADPSLMDNRGWNTLHLAAQGGDTNIISLIHTHLPNIESKTGEGHTPLTVAAWFGKLHAVKWFLEKGATVACECNQGWNTLHCAARGGDTDIISLIHTHLPNIESKTGQGYTPLMVAARFGKLHAVKWFLEKGATVACESNQGWNTLHCAARGGDTDIISLIHTHLPNIESKTGKGKTPLMVAALKGKLHAVKWFLEKGATVACECNNGWNTLHYAAYGGDTDIISLIHTHLPNIESKTGEGYTPLMVAAFTGKLHAVKWFLEKGATVACECNQGWNTLHCAAHGGDTDIISLIHTHLPNVESKTGEGETPLMVAAFTGKLHAVKWFLEKGAIVACETNRGWNTLHFAAQGGDTDIISLIHTHLPNIESKTGDGDTPLMVAALCGKLDAVKWFLEKGATVTSVKSNGWNILHFAAKGSDPDTIDLILTHLPVIESKTSDGKTPLIIAVCHGKLQGVKCLLERGANPSAKDNDGQDSLHHASSLDSDIFDLLLSHVP